MSALASATNIPPTECHIAMGYSEYFIVANFST